MKRYIIQEFIDGGELYSHLTTTGRLSEDNSVRLFRQLISGLAYCHQFQICHRDIKPENLLIDEINNLRIVDFGMASLHYTDRLNTACGSPHYVAPEVASNAPYRGEPADVWSAGVVLFVMLTARLPFGSTCGADEIPELIQQILRCEVEYGDDLPENAEDLFRRIFVVDPTTRITIDEIWKHPFISKYDAMAKDPDPEVAEQWIGGPPEKITQADCGQIISDPESIDKDVLKTLCILWHSGDTKEMLTHLTSPT